MQCTQALFLSQPIHRASVRDSDKTISVLYRNNRIDRDRLVKYFTLCVVQSTVELRKLINTLTIKLPL